MGPQPDASAVIAKMVTASMFIIMVITKGILKTVTDTARELIITTLGTILQEISVRTSSMEKEPITIQMANVTMANGVISVIMVKASCSTLMDCRKKDTGVRVNF